MAQVALLAAWGSPSRVSSSAAAIATLAGSTSMAVMDLSIMVWWMSLGLPPAWACSSLTLLAAARRRVPVPAE